MKGLGGIRDVAVSWHEKCSDVSLLGKVVLIFCNVNHTGENQLLVLRL